MQKRSSHNINSIQIVDAIIKAADVCDPVLINEFFDLTIQTELATLDVIKDTLTYSEMSRRQNVLIQGSILLSLFNHFAAKKLRDGLSIDQVRLG